MIGPQNADTQLAEKCRKALEKSWGFDIPMPKLAGEKQMERGDK